MSTKELVTFLCSPDPKVSKVALEYALQFTPATAGQASIFTDNDYQGLRAIKKLSLESKDVEVVQNALIALINLSDSESIRSELAADKPALDKYFRLVVTAPKQPYVKYACMLLTNLSRELETLESFPPSHLAALALTISKPANIIDEDFDFVMFVFSEFARQDGMKVAKSLPFLFPQLIVHESTLGSSQNRRAGLSAAIKNVLFSANTHSSLANDTLLIETIMSALIGPEEIDPEDYEKLPPTVKKEHQELRSIREPSEDIQMTLLECLLLLSSTQDGRDAMRSRNVYYVIRELHKTTTNNDISEACVKFVNMVMRGEPKEAEIEDEEDRITEVV